MRVNAVCPAAIEGIVGYLIMDYFGMTKDHLGVAVPMGQMRTPGDIAPGVPSSRSDQAAFITGACPAVNGGYSAR